MVSRRRKNRRRTRRRYRRQRGGDLELEYSPENGSKIMVFTSCDHMEPSLQMLLDSLKAHKYSYKVLGFGKKYNGLQDKIVNYLQGMKDYKAKVKDDNALAIFVDGFDMICIKDSDKLFEAYKARKRTMPVIFGSEIFCLFNCNKDILKWYDTHSVLGGKAAVESTFSDIGNGTRAKYPVFLNTGFIMGPISALEEMYTGISQIGYKVDDQYTAGIWLAKNLSKFDLDVEEHLVRNKLETRDKVADENGEDGPAFLHFPGTQGERLKNIERFAQYIKN